MKERQADLFDFHFSGFQDVDLVRRLEAAARDDTLWTDASPCIQAPDCEVEGVVLSLRSLDGRTYLLYAYRFDGIEYGFAWAASADAPPWLEKLTEGLEFSVALCAASPAAHTVTDPRFQALNERVLMLGSFSWDHA